MELLSELQVQGHSSLPLQILERREVEKGGETIQQILVEWQSGEREAATWEEEQSIKDQFPYFNLGDKVASNRGSIVRSHNKKQEKAWKVYSRRRF